jgi:hypothetical protein
MIGIIQTDRDDFTWFDRCQRFDAFARGRFSGERRRPENVSFQAEKFALYDFGVEDILTLAKPSDGSHKKHRQTNKFRRTVARSKQFAGLPFQYFALPYNHELFDETGTAGSVYRPGIIADRLGGQNVSYRASAGSSGSTSPTLNARSKF